jgi:hypothetical protein
MRKLASSLPLSKHKFLTKPLDEALRSIADTTAAAARSESPKPELSEPQVTV